MNELVYGSCQECGFECNIHSQMCGRCARGNTRNRILPLQDPWFAFLKSRVKKYDCRSCKDVFNLRIGDKIIFSNTSEVVEKFVKKIYLFPNFQQGVNSLPPISSLIYPSVSTEEAVNIFSQHIPLSVQDEYGVCIFELED